MTSPDLDRALAQLRRRRVVAAATESFFGLLADATSVEAVDRLLELKPRGAEKGIPLLLPSLEVWRGLVTELPDLARRLAAEFWPGPLTIALPASSAVDPRALLDGRVAVRLPSRSPAAQVASLFGRPVTATSANPPGAAPARTDAEVVRAFPPNDALWIWPGRAPGGEPSTVVVVAGERWEVVRAGAILPARIEAVART